MAPIALLSSASTALLVGHSARLSGRRPISAATSTLNPPLVRPQLSKQAEVMKSLEGWARGHMLPLLKPVEASWQPQDFLPDSSRPLDEFTEEVRALRQRTAELSDDYFVVLVGDLITEDAVPTYQSLINHHDGFRPESAADPGPWATWTRRWTAEENRHGDLLRTYLYLSGRVDMVMVERTVQYLIGSGMEPQTEKNPYMIAVYTSFQERATAISHGNTGRLAKQRGDAALARICGSIAADEKRHEKAYTSLVGKFLEVDPSEAMVAIAEMMRRKITMPAHLMSDGRDPLIYRHFSAVAQRMGVYTTSDYADILEHLVGVWRLEKVEGMTAEGREAQEYVCGLPPRIRSLHQRAQDRAKKVATTRVGFSWIFNKEVCV